MSGEAGPALVVGLGNPGAEYERTRHNAGWRVLDILAARLSARLRPASRHHAFVAEARDPEGGRLVLAKPTTYMNESGVAIASLARFFKVAVERIVMVYDDIDLAQARLRIRLGGGTGGHNGLKSIVSTIGADFVRVRIGVGRPPGRRDPADYVLGRMSKREEEIFAVVFEDAADAALMVVREGVEAAQNRYNPAPA